MTHPEVEIEELQTGAPFGTAPARSWTAVWILGAAYVLWVAVLAVMAFGGPSRVAA